MNAHADVQSSLGELKEKLSHKIELEFEVTRMEPLFASEKEYEDFTERHNKHNVRKGDFASYKGDLFLGIDAGSTTTKVAVIGDDGSLLYSFYSSNNGSPLKTALKAMKDIYSKMPEVQE